LRDLGNGIQEQKNPKIKGSQIHVLVVAALIKKSESIKIYFLKLNMKFAHLFEPYPHTPPNQASVFLWITFSSTKSKC
jgi:hypothetical protein